MKRIAIIAAIAAALVGCYSENMGSKTIVGNHYSLPKLSDEATSTDFEIYESTEGAVVVTRRGSKVGITYENTYTNHILGVWTKVGHMELGVEIEPLAEETAPEPCTASE